MSVAGILSIPLFFLSVMLYNGIYILGKVREALTTELAEIDGLVISVTAQWQIGQDEVDNVFV